MIVGGSIYNLGKENTRRLRAAPSLRKRARIKIFFVFALFYKEGGSAEPGVFLYAGNLYIR